MDGLTLPFGTRRCRGCSYAIGSAASSMLLNGTTGASMAGCHALSLDLQLRTHGRSQAAWTGEAPRTRPYRIAASSAMHVCVYISPKFNGYPADGSVCQHQSLELFWVGPSKKSDARRASRADLVSTYGRIRYVVVST